MENLKNTMETYQRIKTNYREQELILLPESDQKMQRFSFDYKTEVVMDAGDGGEEKSKERRNIFGKLFNRGPNRDH